MNAPFKETIIAGLGELVDQGFEKWMVLATEQDGKLKVSIALNIDVSHAAPAAGLTATWAPNKLRAETVVRGEDPNQTRLEV